MGLQQCLLTVDTLLHLGFSKSRRVQENGTPCVFPPKNTNIFTLDSRDRGWVCLNSPANKTLCILIYTVCSIILYISRLQRELMVHSQPAGLLHVIFCFSVSLSSSFSIVARIFVLLHTVFFSLHGC